MKIRETKVPPGLARVWLDNMERWGKSEGDTKREGQHTTNENF